MSCKWKILGTLPLLVGLTCLIVACVLYLTTGGDIPFDHGVIIDAGSTHSEALLYRWEGDKFQGTGQVKEIDKCDVKPGISSYRDPRDAGKSILPCLKQVSEKVDPEKRSEIPVYVAATGGMRLLNLTNPYQTMAIIIGLDCTIPESGMKVQDVSIINGQDEGLYAWITTNYLKGTIQDKTRLTVGAADMGGASTQISFQVDASLSNNTNVVPLKLYGSEYHVYSVSYLCYGSTEIYRRYLSSLIEDPSKNLKVEDPCANPGLEVKQDASWLFDQPCSKTTKTAEFVFLNPNKMNTSYTFVGKPDENLCRKKIQAFFEPEECSKSYSECFSPIDPLKRPNDFTAFSSYYWTMDFMKAKKTTLKVFKDNVQGYCKTDWAKIKPEDYPAGARADLPRYCFLATMMDIILTEGYGFNETTWENIEFTRKENDISLGWTLGYMTNSTNAIPPEEPIPPILGFPGFISLIVVGVILIIAGIAIWVKANRKSQCLQP